ncbi:DNA recombination protein RmuC [Nocardioides sp. TRM66260-LWL]|uniref:DNA recombination protein RmuC n=1 Tax=Nocardioides sp. TRM66260-LWL TaxID=2874478 RepID=UPI001CC74B92|nr:DNA recombination protein RmuC [Nocardioides sp. TRM66260-LWL]MBZ5736201.1 DNA recombination protein RmuC [Nocardioides sp. TRM66260-LWL]
MTASALLLALVVLLVGAALGFAVGALWQRGRPEQVAALSAAQERVELVQGLDRLSDQLLHLDHQRDTWDARLREQVDAVRRSTELLGTETRALSTALRRPQVRGRWGELHLRRAVELAGLVDRCDFSEQVRLDDGAQRPDLVVSLVGGRSIVVDAKVPLDAYLDATTAEAQGDAALQAKHLARHARQLRTHVDGLASKAYWRALERSPEFVVLFVPAESFLAAALEVEPGLIEHAAERQVVLATPTTLIALLRTVAQGWSHERLAEQAREVHRLGRELHERLAVFGGHLDQVGRSLNAAVGRYNTAVGSLDARVLVTARRFRDLGVTDDGLEAPRQVALRAVHQPEEAQGEQRERPEQSQHSEHSEQQGRSGRRGAPGDPPARPSVVS